MTEEKTTVVDAEIVEEVATIDVYEENGIKLYGSYDEFIERAKGRFLQEGQAMVWSRWTLGAHVKVVLEDSSYGSHKMADLEADLGMKSKTLYACKTLFETYDRDTMEEKVMPKNLSFRALNYIARVDDEDKRDDYMDQVAAGEIKAEDIPQLEAGLTDAELEGGDDTTPVAGEEKSSDEKAATAIRKAVGAVDGPLDLILSNINAAETCLGDLNLLAANDELYDAVSEELEEFRTKLSDLQPKIVALIDRLDKTSNVA